MESMQEYQTMALGILPAGGLAVGDFSSAAGIAGTVKEIGLFATAVGTPDDVPIIIGNGRIFADAIQNFSANPYRRVELLCQLAGSADHVAAIELHNAAGRRGPDRFIIQTKVAQHVEAKSAIGK